MPPYWRNTSRGGEGGGRGGPPEAGERPGTKEYREKRAGVGEGWATKAGRSLLKNTE